jgi:hypothetical protein
MDYIYFCFHFLDASYVLLHYKTEQCKRPPRLCRQGYACPQYHNLRDRRRSPKKHKYRSTPCPNVKHGDEWGEPALCEEGDSCAYCHTRTEQQFHPEIYKSSKVVFKINVSRCFYYLHQIHTHRCVFCLLFSV